MGSRTGCWVCRNSAIILHGILDCIGCITEELHSVALEQKILFLYVFFKTTAADSRIRLKL